MGRHEWIKNIEGEKLADMMWIWNRAWTMRRGSSILGMIIFEVSLRHKIADRCQRRQIY